MTALPVRRSSTAEVHIPNCCRRDGNGPKLLTSITSGEVIGNGYDSTGTAKGFIYSGGTYAELLPPGWTRSYVNAINDSGEVIGNREAYTIDNQKGFLYREGIYTELLLPGWTMSYVNAINDSGEVIGTGYEFNTGKSKGFIYRRGIYTELLPPGWYGCNSSTHQ